MFQNRTASTGVGDTSNVLFAYQETTEMIDTDEQNTTLRLSSFLVVDVEAGKQYAFRCHAIFEEFVPLTGSGVHIAFDGTATASSFIAQPDYRSNAPLEGLGEKIQVATPAVPMVVEGSMTIDTAGTFGLSWSKHVTTSGKRLLLLEGSNLLVWELA